MTLKEKFWELNQKQKNLELAQECEKIADEFAMGFGDWLNNGRFSQYGDSWIDPRKNKDKGGDWLFLSSKQLLETYKKEKGL
jgi:hypothetical protein